MSEIFLKVVNMSISAGWLVLAVLLLRLVLKKAPKWVNVLLWGLVAVRLICPFSFESILSLIPSTETISPGIMLDATPEIHTGIGALNSVINPVISQSFAPNPGDSANPLQIWIPIAAVVWLAGFAIMLVYTAVSYLMLRRKVATAVMLKDNIFQSEYVDSPFVLGIIKPRIYLPFQMNGEQLVLVVAHEQAHIRRKDHWWKPLGFLLLAIYWFHPLMWLGYILLCRDIELACDEKVIQDMDSQTKADYSEALVACSVSRRRIAACPLAFGEVGVKDRVKSVMHYKKPALWILLAAILLCIAAAVCFLTDPPMPTLDALPLVHSHGYTVAEKTYVSKNLKEDQFVNSHFRITQNMALDIKLNHIAVSYNGWVSFGQLTEFDLTKENFDDLFATAGWNGKHNAGSLRKNNAHAWQVIYNQENLYYVLQQKNGDVYLAAGYYDASEKNDPYSDDTSIHWVCKLGIDTKIGAGMVASSGYRSVPMVAFPKGTALKDYLDAIHWLTIDPYGEDFVPFHTAKDGVVTYGAYTAYDAETFEPLKHIVPSGLSPQTYLFQNADPERAYIVLAAFGTDADSVIYAFGVRFGDENSALDALKEAVPEYFGLDASNGLDVYVWQMAKNSYSFGLLPHSEIMRYNDLDVQINLKETSPADMRMVLAAQLAQKDRMVKLMEIKGVGAAAMRMILSTYDVEQEKIYVIPWQNPLSSYIGDYWIIEEGVDMEQKRNAYVQNLRNMLFGQE